jgi:hypothetical protein
MNSGHALFGLVAIIVPAGAVIYGLVAFGIITTRKLPEDNKKPMPRPRPPRKTPPGRQPPKPR